MYKAVFHIDLDEMKPLKIGLNNMTNLLKATAGTEDELIMLFNGPAVTLLAPELLAPFSEQIDRLMEQGCIFQACRNALEAAAMDEHQLPAGFTVIPAGIVALIDLQHKGFAYIKP
jgi:uncharacterized protein